MGDHLEREGEEVLDAVLRGPPDHVRGAHADGEGGDGRGVDDGLLRRHAAPSISIGGRDVERDGAHAADDGAHHDDVVPRGRPPGHCGALDRELRAQASRTATDLGA